MTICFNLYCATDLLSHTHRWTVALFGELKAQYKIDIVYHHFAAYHGKGPCDGHTGVFKQKVKRYVRTGKDINGLDDYLLVIGSVKNTHTRHREEGDDCPEINSLDGVKKYNRFEYYKAGVVRCFSTSDTLQDQGNDIVIVMFLQLQSDLTSFCRQ
jgi:hypothetical protein